jgi:predicted nuclease of predicted toxin-antitoxin system
MNCDDSVVWNYAKQNKYTIVTFDSDFYDISLINGCPPKIIWIRTGNVSTIQLLDLLLKNIERIRSFSEDSENREVACIELE